MFDLKRKFRSDDDDITAILKYLSVFDVIVTRQIVLLDNY